MLASNCSYNKESGRTDKFKGEKIIVKIKEARQIIDAPEFGPFARVCTSEEWIQAHVELLVTGEMKIGSDGKSLKRNGHFAGFIWPDLRTAYEEELQEVEGSWSEMGDDPHGKNWR